MRAAYRKKMSRMRSDVGLGEQKVMKFGHEAIVERGKILKTIRTGFFEAFEKENLMTWVELF